MFATVSCRRSPFFPGWRLDPALSGHRVPIPDEEPLPGNPPVPDEDELPPHPDPVIRLPSAGAAVPAAADKTVPIVRFH